MEIVVNVVNKELIPLPVLSPEMIACILSDSKRVDGHFVPNPNHDPIVALDPNECDLRELYHCVAIYAIYDPRGMVGKFHQNTLKYIANIVNTHPENDDITVYTNAIVANKAVNDDGLENYIRGWKLSYDWIVVSCRNFLEHRSDFYRVLMFNSIRNFPYTMRAPLVAVTSRKNNCAYIPNHLMRFVWQHAAEELAADCENSTVVCCAGYVREMIATGCNIGEEFID